MCCDIYWRNIVFEFGLFVESLLQKEGVLNSHENLQFWQSAQPILDGHPLGGCGSGFGLVPGYTTLAVRVWANIKCNALKIKSVRTNEQKV